MLMDSPNPDLEKETLLPTCHCESRQKREKVRACTPKRSACLREAPHCGTKAGRASVAISLKKARLLRFTRRDNSLNRDFGMGRIMDRGGGQAEGEGKFKTFLDGLS